MKVLYLGPKREMLISHMELQGDEVRHTEEIISLESTILEEIEFIVSFGYRHLIKRTIIDLFPQRIINLHISLLPWNKGSDPNLWSFLEDTPKGVTIHYIDYGLDTGEILVQQEVIMDNNDTLSSSYNKLESSIVELFKKDWVGIRDCQIAAYPQPIGGSIHRMKDKAQYEQYLTEGWETPISKLVGRARDMD
ncbi:formyltransferase family protein [Paenibacillus agricola]|uniref:phosphoribosylglycinamide formyltransferase 1 n=1 Tax=Paenibacillus agricola TaxID=2716264 RepID=A0ABX0JCK3_9BACL|nr:formyltransferase family protein [Paenibacillus agricola]NHN33887.1 formyl transferase [Paenibacillus agricola]